MKTNIRKIALALVVAACCAGAARGIDVSDQAETRKFFLPPTVNKTGTGAVAEWYANATKKGFSVSMSVYLEKDADEIWRPSHYVVGMQSQIASVNE